tara:strand:+ start:6669 stop:7937 length:1269 start_codon:yes stop_codon:yes gene_type:complete
MIELNSEYKERALLVGAIHSGNTREEVEEHLNELELLTSSAGAEVTGIVIQRLAAINPKYFIGKGKADQIIHQAMELKLDLIIFDDELSPSQVRNYQKVCEGIKVMDRTGLILDVFRKHAKTKEAKTQVELAHLEYLLPRLTRMWTHLERQMGGIGTRAGAGELQIEVDRRIIRDKISKLKKKLIIIDHERDVQSKQRKGIFRVALVGYTNAGKSTLMNSMTNAHVPVKDQLFATLDTTIRTLTINSHHKILLSDSVGFIRKIPHHLVSSFRSTLKEVNDSDLLLIVLDASSPFVEDHLTTVREVLNTINAGKTDYILVMNKIDNVQDKTELSSLKVQYPEGVFISALNHLRLDVLQDEIVEKIKSSYLTATVTFDHTMGKEISMVHNLVEVLDTKYVNGRTELKVRGDVESVDRIKALQKD